MTMENHKLSITGIQILQNDNDVLANIGIDDKYLLQLKKGGFYIPSSTEDFWGQNRTIQDEFKKSFELNNLIDLITELGINNVKSASDLRTYCEENYILIEII